SKSCLILLACSSCLVAYKKTPPPVPLRTTSKPFISQSRAVLTTNSSDSLDSSTQGGVAPKLPPKHAALKSEQGTLTSSESHPEAAPKRKLSSIGRQVDCIQPVPKAEPSPAPIRVQVEDDWQSSVPSHGMSSQWDRDSDTQDVNNSSCKSSERSLPDCTPPLNSISTDCNLSYGDNSDPALEASSLPQPDPWLKTSSSSPAEPAQPGPAAKTLLQAETEQLEGWCTEENNLSEEVSEKVLSVVSNAQLLMSQKFWQFRGLCEQNLNPDANPRPTAQDLAGFWDLLQLSIKDIRMKFDELYHLKQLVVTPKKRKRRNHPLRFQRSSQIQAEARKRLPVAKWAASVRQNSAESMDSIEMYVPEAQTRL
uniref:DLG associated protein 4 n=1 Tax=Rhinopithecus roxellana TaxID=61622 RepID=A0A2K6PYJ3_RHIRO